MSRALERVQRPLPADRAFAALWRALKPHLGAHRLLSASSRDWASATFVGARHLIGLVLDGADAAARAMRLHAMLSEVELPIAGGVVADLQIMVLVENDRTTIAIEALTIEEEDDGRARVPAARVSRDVRRAG